MKKLVSFVCAALLMVTMSMTAFAGGNPNPSVTAKPIPDGGTSSTSPSTGEPIMIMCAIGAVVVGSAGVVITGKKRAQADIAKGKKRTFALCVEIREGRFSAIGNSYRRKTLREDRRGAEDVDIASQTRLAQEFASELFF